MKMQHTIKDIIEFSGIGLHTGRDINVRLIPSGTDTGITFSRKDIPGSPVIRACASNVVATSYATTIGTKGVTVSTIEHLMAAFYGLGVDNVMVELDGPEVPVMDGSASHFIEAIEGAGLKTQDGLRRCLVIKRPVKVEDRDKYVLFLPSEEAEFTIDYSIDFSHPMLNKQTFSRLFSTDVFKKEIAGARTFGFLRDIETLKANGLAKGGSLSNAIVIGESDILNADGLRYPDEFVRHKVLDLMGDISLIGAPVIGRLIVHRSGHSLNYRLVQEILRKPARWEFTDTFAGEEEGDSKRSVLMEEAVTV
ncbi:MAG: UDP-3-O-acyl-N-acetylglucosamine deacetylase [Deltaproteobacteria bacterium]